MFHLATSAMSAPARQQAVDALGPRTRLIRSYLARNVLDELDNDRRRFLDRHVRARPAHRLSCATSCSARPAARTCSTRWSATSCSPRRSTTGSASAITRCCSATSSWRWSPIAAPTARAVWYARCAELLEAAGAHRDALRAFALAEDWRSVARLVRRNSADVTSAIAAEPDGLLPAALLQDDPWLALADARRGLRRGAIAHAIAAFRHAESLLDEPHFRDTCVGGAARSVSLAARSSARAEAGGWTDRLRALTRGSARGR